MNSRQREGFLYLLPLLILVVILAVTILPSEKEAREQRYEERFEDKGASPSPVEHTAQQARREKRRERQYTLQPFDPNSSTVDEFCAMGFSEAQAKVIIKFRNSIGGFRTPEKFGECYVVSQERYQMLKPYIKIAPQVEEAKPAPAAIAPPPEVKESVLASFVEEKVDVNSADSATLCSVKGIGPATAKAIVAYRKMLGGFHSVDQLAEIPVVREKNFELFCKEIYADSSEIQKIDINFASPKQITAHLYMSGKVGRKILKQRQLKGGWVCIEDMAGDCELTPGQVKSLAPYLIFTDRVKLLPEQEN